MEIKRFIGGLLEANCYVITATGQMSAGQAAAGRTAGYSGGPCFIIDPGYSPKKIIKYVREKSLDPRGIILTHHHNDHGGGAPLIRKELDCPVMIHTLDADRYGHDVDIYLEEGDVVRFDDSDGNRKGQGEALEVLHTPGHTEGGICLMCREDKICFTGDTIFNVDLGRTDLEDGSESSMRRSIKEVVDKWGNEITIYPGHGDPATMKTVRKINKEFLEIINDD